MAGNRNSGRRPKPTSILKMEGKYQHYAHENRGVELAAKGEPAKPDGMSPEASDFWDRVIPQLVELGVARRVDSDSLRQMAEWWASYVREMAAYQRGDDHAFNRMVKAQDKFLQWGDRFGLSPSARIRLSTAPEKKPTQDPAAKYFG